VSLMCEVGRRVYERMKKVVLTKIEAVVWANRFIRVTQAK
jgi:hypothetical protein